MSKLEKQLSGSIKKNQGCPSIFQTSAKRNRHPPTTWSWLSHLFESWQTPSFQRPNFTSLNTKLRQTVSDYSPKGQNTESLPKYLFTLVVLSHFMEVRNLIWYLVYIEMKLWNFVMFIWKKVRQVGTWAYGERGRRKVQTGISPCGRHRITIYVE